LAKGVSKNPKMKVHDNINIYNATKYLEETLPIKAMEIMAKVPFFGSKSAS
jgi:hypothetical protein